MIILGLQKSSLFKRRERQGKIKMPIVQAQNTKHMKNKNVQSERRAKQLEKPVVIKVTSAI